jgi:hypothetical protein
MVPWGDHEVRAVTHYGIGRAEVARAIEAVRRVMVDVAPLAVAS